MKDLLRSLARLERTGPLQPVVTWLAIIQHVISV
jgi:hypothetical protein